MRLYNFFLLITIILSTNGCSIYHKIFKVKTDKLLIEKTKQNLQNKDKISLIPTGSSLEENIVLEKEKHYIRINIFRNELLIRYSSKVYLQNSTDKASLNISLPFHSTIIETKLVDSFTKSYCATSKNLAPLPQIDTISDIFRKYYTLDIHCKDKSEYLDFTLIYSLPLDLISSYHIRNKLYAINVNKLLLVHHDKKYEEAERKIYGNISNNYTLFFNNSIKIIKPHLYEIQQPQKSNALLIITKPKKISIQTEGANTFRINGRYQLSKIKASLSLINKILFFFRVLFSKKENSKVNIFFHIERFSFIEGNNIFIGSDISQDLFSGFMPAKLIRLILNSFYHCSFSPYINAASQEYLADFFLSEEYKTSLNIIRYKKLNIISSYIYKSIQKSIQNVSYEKELRNQLKTFLAYFYFVKMYKNNYLKFASDVRRCKLQLSINEITIPKIRVKALSENKFLLVFTKNLKKYSSSIPIKINDEIKEIPLKNSVCNNYFCNLYIENAQRIKIDPEYRILRLLDRGELIPSFQSLSLNNKIKTKIISPSKRNWAVLYEFIKVLSKYIDIEYENKGLAHLIVLIYEGDLKFFEKESSRQLPCINLKNGILYNKIILSKHLFGIISCIQNGETKTLIFAPTFYHLYLLSAEEIKKTSWKSIWIWNKKRLIYADDILDAMQQ